MSWRLGFSVCDRSGLVHRPELLAAACTLASGYLQQLPERVPSLLLYTDRCYEQFRVLTQPFSRVHRYTRLSACTL